MHLAASITPRSLFATLACVIYCSLVFGQPSSTNIVRQYRYVPSTPLALGRGLDPGNVNEAKFPCIVFTELPLVRGAATTHVYASIVRDYSEFAEATNLDLSASADMLAGSASAHFDVHTNDSFSSTTINVVVNAITDYGQYGLSANPEPHLTKDAQELKDTDPPEFERRCGSAYVSLEHRMSSAGILISVASIHASSKRSLEAKAGGQVGGLGMSASASASFTRELKSAIDQSRVVFQAFSTGGDGFGALGDMPKALANQTDPLSALMDSLSKFMSSFAKGNAAPYSFTASSMKDFGWDPSRGALWNSDKDERLKGIVAIHRRYDDIVKNMENYQNGGVWRTAIAARKIPPLDSYYSHAMSNVLPIVKKIRSDLEAAYARCLSGKTVSACPIPDPIDQAFAIFETPASPHLEWSLIPVSDNASISAQLSQSRAKAVLSERDDIRLTVLQNFVPNATHFSASINVVGDYLDAMSIVFVSGNDGKQYSVFVPKVAGGILWITVPRNDAVDRFSNEVLVEDWMAQLSKEDGIFYLSVSDLLGRSFLLPICEKAWTIDNGVAKESDRDYML